MKQLKIAELKDGLSRHLREVAAGMEIEVTDRRRPVARLVPIESSATAPKLRPPQRAFREVRGLRHRAARWNGSSLDLLLEERGRR